MRKTITTALLLVAISTAFGQQRLPVKVTITLTDKQIMRLDSAINLGQSVMDSKAQTNWFMASFAELYNQVRKQLVTDTLNKKP